MKLPVALSGAALVVAVFGSTPLGNAARELVIPRASVGTPQLKNNAVTGLKVKNFSLTASDFRQNSLPRGPQGPTGPAGPAGPAGPQGPAGISGLDTVFTTGAINSTSTRALTAGCPAGKRVIGGGATILPANQPGIAITSSYMGADNTWIARAREVTSTSSNWSLNAVAVCANAS